MHAHGGQEILNRSERPARSIIEAHRAQCQVCLEAKPVGHSIRGYRVRGLGPRGGSDTEAERVWRVRGMDESIIVLHMGAAGQARRGDSGAAPPAPDAQEAHAREQSGHGRQGRVDPDVQDLPADAGAGPAELACPGGADVRRVQKRHADRMHGAAGQAGEAEFFLVRMERSPDWSIPCRRSTCTRPSSTRPPCSSCWTSARSTLPR